MLKPVVGPRFGTAHSGVAYIPQIEQAKGRLILISGPSGVGKGVVIRSLFADRWIRTQVSPVQSVTTRPPRPGEGKPSLASRAMAFFKQQVYETCNYIHQQLRLPPCPLSIIDSTKKQYQFIPTDAFLRLKQENKLFQWTYYDKNWYGSTVKDVLTKLQKGKLVLLELTATDALALKGFYKGKITTIFIAPPPPEMETLKKRLIGRGSNTPESIAERLRQAEAELALKPQFDVVVVNEENRLEKTVAMVKGIMMQNLSQIRFAGLLKSRCA